MFTDEIGKLQQPLVAWSQGISSEFSKAFILKLLTEHQGIGIRDIPRYLEGKIERPPVLSTVFNLLKTAKDKDNDWIQSVKQGRSSSLAVTTKGRNHLSEETLALFEILDRSYRVIEAWEKELYMGRIPPTQPDANDLFDPGGITEVHRTLMLHIAAYRKKFDELDQGRSRHYYFLEIFDYMESKFGWRASDSILSKIKNEKDKTKDGRIIRNFETIPRTISIKSEKRESMEGTVHLLTITPEGRERLQTALLTTWGTLQKTRAVLDSWKNYLGGSQA